MHAFYLLTLYTFSIMTRREIYLREIVSPKYPYLSKPYQNSYLRTYVLYRSLHWRTRLCLQPEGIV